MTLESTDIDAKLDQMAQSLRSLRAAAQEVKQSTNRAVSELSQFSQDEQSYDGVGLTVKRRIWGDK